MANREHLEILGKGVEEWNRWRKNRNRHERPNLNLADLRGARLSGARLSEAYLNNADLRGADLSGALLRRAHLSGADLTDAKLRGARLNGASLSGALLHRAHLCHAVLRDANLVGARLSGADLSGADLSSALLIDADLSSAHLSYADLRDASLRSADLGGANLSNASLSGVELQKAFLGSASVSAVDLSQARSLEQVSHSAPSSLATDTLTLSKGKIPEAFLRGCGLTDWEIQAAKLWDPDLTRDERTEIAYEVVNLQAESPIVLHHVFISYSHADTIFVEKLETGLDEKRIRYWRDVHDMKAGRTEKQIEKAIRINPLVLLVLSERSVESDWVEWEVSKARELEKTEDRDVLCPIALDDAWKTCDWPGPVRQQVMDYNILDFSDPERFDQQFEKLVGGIVENYPPG